MMENQEALFDTIADALVECGYWIGDDALPQSVGAGLLQVFNQLQSTEFKSAGIGRQTDFQVEDTIRADKIRWITGDQPATTEFLQWMDTIKAALNRRLFMGLFDYESHFAHYPVGAFYKKHLDAFRHKNGQPTSNRVLSTVYYLNENWLPENGGELLIYNESDSAVVEKVSPLFGRMVVFLSEKFPHEVLPAHRERKSIAGWFRVNEGALS
jgi:SM-20-related protein